MAGQLLGALKGLGLVPTQACLQGLADSSSTLPLDVQALWK